MGSVTPGLVLVAVHGGSVYVLFLALWTVCYAVYAALLSTALPAGR